MKNVMIAASVVAAVAGIAGCAGLKDGTNPYAALVKGAPAGANTLTDHSDSIVSFCNLKIKEL